MNVPASRPRVQLALGAEIAIKLLDFGPSSEADGRFRLMQELTAAARIQSEHVVRILDHGFSTGGRGFIVTERLHGEDLERRLARPSPLSLAEVSSIVAAACAGLAAGHALGLVHRHIEPSHIFLLEGEGAVRVKLLNFGVQGPSGARARGLAYASPEVTDDAALDGRADLFSLALVAHRCLTGRLPRMGGAGPEHAPPASRFDARLTEALAHWFDGMLQREPGARSCQDPAQLAQTFAQACGVEPANDGGQRRQGVVLAGLPAAAIAPPREAILPSPSVLGHESEPLPSIESPAAVPVGVAVRRPRGLPTVVVVGLLAFVATASAMIGFLLRHYHEESLASVVRDASPRPEPEPPAPLAIHLFIRVVPREASLILDGQHLADNPFSSVRRADAAPHWLRAEAPGYHSVERELSLSRDLVVELSLSPVAAPSAEVRSPSRAAGLEQQTRLQKRAPSPARPIGEPAPRTTAPEPKPLKLPLSVDRTNPWQTP